MSHQKSIHPRLSFHSDASRVIGRVIPKPMDLHFSRQNLVVKTKGHISSLQHSFFFPDSTIFGIIELFGLELEVTGYILPETIEIFFSMSCRVQTAVSNTTSLHFIAL